MKRLHAKAVTALALLAALLPAAALALTYSPPSFDLAADRGAVLSETIKTRNNTVVPEDITLSALNFTGKAGDETSGVPDFYPANEVRDGKGMADWISFPKKQLTLQPGQQADIDFQIIVPKDADAGSHFGAVVMTVKSPPGKDGVSITTENISLVLLTVGGEAKEDLKLTSFTAAPSFTDAPPIAFVTRLQNDGNLHERPYGEIVIKSPFGRTVATIPFNRADNKSVLPGMARRYDTDWKGRSKEHASHLAQEWNDFHIGPYTATLSLTYGPQKKTLTAATTVWFFPWFALLLAVVGLAALVIGLKKFFKWYDKMVIKRHEQKRLTP